jgi:hypothetical protein
MMYRILLGLDIIAVGIAVFFFFLGMADGTVSDFNIELWIGLLLGIAAVLGVGIALRRAAWPILANIVLAVLAVPTALYGAFMLVVILSGTPWN